MDKDSWIIIAAIAAVGAFMWTGHASLDRRLQRIESSVETMNTRLSRIEGRLDIPMEPELERASKDPELAHGGPRRVQNLPEAPQSPLRYSSPAPLAHWYFAPRIATGSSVVYGHDTMPRS